MQDHENKMVLGVIIGALYIAFIIIAAFAFISNRHPFFVKHKLKIGALILSLSGTVINGCNNTISCYVSVERMENITIDSNFVDDREISYYKSMPNAISGKIFNRECQQFYYSIYDEYDSLIEANEISILDKKIDEREEAFEIIFSDTIPIGEFKLILHHLETDASNNYCSFSGNIYKLKVFE